MSPILMAWTVALGSSGAARACDARAFQPDTAPRMAQELAAALAPARVVALGEATHGTAEFQALRYLIIRELIEERGFTAILLEDPIGQVALFPGGRNQAGHQRPGYWMWRSPAHSFLMQYLGDSSDRVAVFGMDAAPGFTDAARAWQAACDKAPCDAEPDRAFDALLASEVIRDRKPIWPFVKRFQRQRDERMATVVAWAAERYGKVIVLAHTYHVARHAGWMGGYLDTQFGHEYQVVAMTSGGGSADAIRRGDRLVVGLPPPRSDSIEAVVGQASNGGYGWARGDCGPEGGFSTLVLGASDRGSGYGWLPPNSVDHILYIDQTTPASAGVDARAWGLRGP